MDAVRIKFSCPVDDFTSITIPFCSCVPGVSRHATLVSFEIFAIRVAKIPVNNRTVGDFIWGT
jgi:hypothetical protein